jgi:DNA-binding IclR family transcriptional regulator
MAARRSERASPKAAKPVRKALAKRSSAKRLLLEAGQRRPERPMLLRALRLIETVAGAGRGLSLSDLVLILGIPKPTVFRLTQRLEGAGYLIREPGNAGFSIGPKLLRLSLDAVRTGGAHPERQAILKALVALLGETCNVTALAGAEVLYLDRVETRWPLRVDIAPGSRAPLHCTASGKLFLAHMPADRRRRLLRNLELTAETPATITRVDHLEQECAKVLREGYGADDEEYQRGLIALAVPVTTASGAVVAAIACHAPRARLTVDQAVQRLPEMREAARKLAATLPE